MQQQQQYHDDDDDDEAVEAAVMALLQQTIRDAGQPTRIKDWATAMFNTMVRVTRGPTKAMDWTACKPSPYSAGTDNSWLGHVAVTSLANVLLFPVLLVVLLLC